MKLNIFKQTFHKVTGKLKTYALNENMPSRLYIKLKFNWCKDLG